MTSRAKLDTISVIGIGQDVTIGDDIPAIVDEISIGPSTCVSYRCSWWDGRTAYSEWLPAHRVTCGTRTKHVVVGFNRGG